MNKQKAKVVNEERKYKEELYALFHELAWKVKRLKATNGEDKVNYNIESITFSQLIKLLKEVIDILIQQSQTVNEKANTKAEEVNQMNDDSKQYEQMLQRYEANERMLLKRNFLLITHIALNENKFHLYVKYENKLNQMKELIKYERRKISMEERKNNKVTFLKTEICILKKAIADLETKSSRKDRQIWELRDQFTQLKKQVLIHQKDINVFNPRNEIIKTNGKLPSNKCNLDTNLLLSGETPMKKHSDILKQISNKSMTNSTHITFDVLTNKLPNRKMKAGSKLNCSINKLFAFTHRTVIPNREISNNCQAKIKSSSITFNQNSLKLNQARVDNKCNFFTTRKSKISLSRLVLSKTLTSGFNNSFMSKSHSKADIDLQ